MKRTFSLPDGAETVIPPFFFFDMRAILVGVGAALGIYCLNLFPGALAFLLGLGAATVTGFVGAGFSPETFMQNLQVSEILQKVLPAGTELPRTLGMIPAPRPRNVQEVQRNLRSAGLENCSLIVGLDFTKSNTDQGYATYNGRSLHSLEWANEGKLNPYQEVLHIIGDTLANLDDDGLIPAYYFGDKTTRDFAVKALGEKPAHGFDELNAQYVKAIGGAKLDGPTSFGPLIREACKIVHEANYEFHVLLIITDGAVNDRNNDTLNAIVEAAAQYPLAIIAVGVGDGPWGEMTKFDDELPERRFDNFTFVNYESIKRKFDGSEVIFAEEALRETPAQYKFCRANGLLGGRPVATFARGKGRGGH